MPQGVALDQPFGGLDGVGELARKARRIDGPHRLTEAVRARRSLNCRAG
ncbi:hypothetical protein KCH_59180 [Kitasatospora cheerisanensis KCTC 2395]|uniref:Uncharacterized protein n=1 Tax=Kitasatospora cheerisanensis KCTC 2395 TaxID=1348663 RepID=A0A066YWD0_9ACTN|nr:hypothetical protein KCH_59180 [Kitasatospora cheerisanensis KCTC 2395]